MVDDAGELAKQTAISKLRGPYEYAAFNKQLTLTHFTVNSSFNRKES